MISPSKRRARLGLEAMQHAPRKSSLCTQSARSKHSKHIQFATFMQYPARKGYNYGPTSDEVTIVREAGYVVSGHEAVSSTSSASSPVAVSSSSLASSPPACPVIQFGTLPLSPQGLSHACDKSGFSGGLLLPATASLDSPVLPSVASLDLVTALGSSAQPICLSDDEVESPSSPAIQFPSPKDIVDDLQSFDEMIEDLAASYWDCQNCLGMRHTSETCTNPIRCRNCFRSGHIKKDCTGHAPDLSLWVPKVPSPSFGNHERKKSYSASLASSVSQDQTTPEQKTPDPATPPPPSPLP